MQQLNQYWDQLSQKSIIHQLNFRKSARLHRSCLYSNSVNTGTISAKVQNCIGVTYTVTQSILELFKLEVDYSSTSFHQNCKIAQDLLIQQLNQHWNYSSQKSIIHQFCSGKSEKLQKSRLYSNSALELFKLEVDYSSTLFQQKCKIAQESLIQQLNHHWNYLSQKSIVHHLCFSKIARLQDCIGVAYTATQSILELFKLEVNY